MLQKVPVGSNSNERYFPAFDGLRAIAICMVFFCHYLGWYFGTYGVNIFLVLSGFLITGVLYDSRDAIHRFRNFYVRRTLRIFPVYYGFWLLMLLLTPVLGVQWTRGNWLYAVYLGNYIHSWFGSAVASHPDLLDLYATRMPFIHMKAGSQYPISIGHFWSLCVEEQFYLVWPLVVYFVKARRTLIRICLWLIVLVPLARLGATWIFSWNPMAIWTFTWLRCDEFLIGGAAALLVRSSYAARLVESGKILLGAGLAGSIVLAGLARVISNPATLFRLQITIQFAAIDAAALGIMLMGMRDKSLLTRSLSWSPLRALGRISYGFYIFHDIPHALYAEVIARWSNRYPSGLFRLLPANIWTLMLAFVATVMLATFSYVLIEQPFLRLKNYWAPNRPKHKPSPSLQPDNSH
jgi:peptidoglycan/LPS O-acetylase OafA/YrhL